MVQAATFIPASDPATGLGMTRAVLRVWRVIMNTLIRTRRYLCAALLLLSPLAAVQSVAQDAEKQSASELEKHTTYATLDAGPR
ncbi:MAG: hypothetical protein SangKO_006510 [Sandaracinaceae bacterium]